MQPVREPAVAGQFYPDQPELLRKQLRAFLGASSPGHLKAPPMAILAPHAGYIYCGSVAGLSYNQVRGQHLDTVVVLSPSHRVGFRGVSVWPKGSYRTPLGSVQVDEERCDLLMKSSLMIRDLPEAHSREHALEVQVPFLQETLAGGWKLIPLVMGSQDLESAQELAKVLEKVMDGSRFLVVASSDLSHFYPSQVAEKMDRRVLKYMEQVDPEGLWEEVSAGRLEACGIGPILTTLRLVRSAGVKKGEVLGYSHSGEVSGDNSRVVGYGAVCWRKDMKEEKGETAKVGVDLGLTEDEKKLLKDIARQSIATAFEGKAAPEISDVPPRLREPRGAFVTLEKNKRLRGCIGFIQAVKPLYETVRDMARAAAFEDPRFPPLSQEEWPKVEVEISVLTPMQRVTDISQVKVGTHGLYVVRGPRRGLLLPQVATDNGWGLETFLSQTCIKAGLPPDAWKDPQTEIYAFSADVF
ncbi:MAG: AmmeMemoRadiSam system protein B [bacterium]